ncbi:protein yellow isoform X1 [Neodiprion virginianus]|uniref:protein yellow isoform X1 n=2 Tax=Neodiprion virginianus TaxID=2961670 RepID=UPI001EE7533B|nr:protein yellow isoform X1 [Neodiprion virginianus]
MWRTCNTRPADGTDIKSHPEKRTMSVCGRSNHGLATVLLLAFLGTQTTSAIDNLRVAHQWKSLEYAWPDEDTRQLFPAYNREDNLPLGLEVAGDKLFITVPRWRSGVAASLNYIKLNDTSESPLLNPYPSWEAHHYGAAGVPEVVSTFRIRADRCGRLWVLDTGLADILGSPEQQAPPTLVVYDLANDQILRKFVIPEMQRTGESLFANIAVEDESCEDSFGYLADLGSPGLVVYSWRRNVSWLVKHHFFHPDPQSGEFNVSGVSFQWKDGLFGLALAPAADGYSTLYFHPLCSTMEFSVNTRLLRDPERAMMPDSFHEFKVLGSRGPNGQSSVSFLDPSTGILFYALTNLNAIACWRSGGKYNILEQGRVYMDNVTMVFPNDLKVDRQGNIWVLSDRLPTFMYGQLDPNDYNFRILTGSVREAVAGTVCSMPPITSSSRSPPISSTTPKVGVRIAGPLGTDSGQSTNVSSTLVLLLAFAFFAKIIC